MKISYVVKLGDKNSVVEWDEEKFFAHLRKVSTGDELEVAERIINRLKRGIREEVRRKI